jgi:peroxiredoxin (alkyl hydroperoxide reductase subunit C)
MAIGRGYGMIDSNAQDSSAVRATYFIDPQGVIRAMTWYPMTVGRSVDEMLRMVIALQRTTTEEVMTPADWQPGGDVLLPAAQDQKTAFGSGEGAGWFYRKRADKP